MGLSRMRLQPYPTPEDLKGLFEFHFRKSGLWGKIISFFHRRMKMNSLALREKYKAGTRNGASSIITFKYEK